jgi:serine protease AprX
MSRTKAALILDPDRRDEQLAYLSERVETLYEVGDQLWVSMTEDQSERLAVQGIAVQLHEEADLIELPALTFDPASGSPEPPEDLRAKQPPQGATAYYLVQFVAPPDPTWAHEILRLGGSYVQNLPVNAGLFKLSAIRASEVGQLGFVSWVGLYHPAYALSHVLAGRDEPFTTASLREIAVVPESLPPAEGGNVQVRLFDDVDPDAARAAVEAAGVTIVADTGQGFVVSTDAAGVSRLLRVAGVFAVEINYPVGPANDRAGVITGVNQVRNFRKVDFLVNLDGTGEIVGVMDLGLSDGTMAGVHGDLAARVLRIGNLNTPGNPVPDRFNFPPDPTNYWHGTHVTGTIAGNGARSAGRVRGVAPACHVIFHGPIAANFLGAFTIAHDVGARVHNNSWGTNNIVTNNLYSAAVSDVIDRFCFSHPESLVLFAAHNHETDVQPAPNDGALDMNRLPLQALAKNILTVGAAESRRSNDGFPNDYRSYFPPRYNHANLLPLATGAAGAFTMSDNPNQMALFSNRGVVNTTTTAGVVPTGRVKPDLVAPGTNILSLRSSLAPPPTPAAGGTAGWMDPVPATCDPAFYGIMHGTSMATPLVSGGAVLVRQFYRSRFGQLRRPLLLERVSSIVDLPTIASHRDGRVVAWVRRDSTSGQNHVVAARYDRDWRRQGDVVVLQTNVGDHPALVLARHADNTLLLHRASDKTIGLSLYDAALAPVNAFGSGGTITLAPASRPEDSRRPGLCVKGNEAAVVWNEDGGDRLLFRRYRADNGNTLDSSPQAVGDMTHSSSHPFIVNDGTNYAVVWARSEGADRKLQMRLVDGSGKPVGAQPATLVTQASEVREPNLAWDPRSKRFVVVWAGSETNADGEASCIFVDPAGSPVGTAAIVTRVPAGNTVRRTSIAPHPDDGYVLLWEDDTQKDKDNNNRYDVYMAFLDNTGQPDRLPRDPTDPPMPDPGARPPRQLLRISDTPKNTAGLTGLVDTDGVAIAWQSDDEINSDLLGVYGLSVTPQGAFGAQEDSNTPIINSGRYRVHTLIEHDLQNLGSVSMAWAGGAYYLLRKGPGAGLNELQLVRTNADGLVDTTYATNGVRELAPGLFFRQHEMHWTGDRLICASVDDSTGPDIFLLDASGEPVKEFGIEGWQWIDEGATTNAAISPQLGHLAEPEFRIIVAYGADSPQTNLRYAVLNVNAQFFVSPLSLVRADGTARHGWFHYISSEAISIAVWHREAAGKTTVYVNQFSIRGTPQHAHVTASGDREPDDIRLTMLAGDSKNAVVAARPVSINSSKREYGAAWQHRADAAQPWEIRFSRLDRDGYPMDGAPSLPAPPGGTRDVRVIFPGAPGWPAATHATDPQLVCTYIHQLWTTARRWSPGYGLAWLGQDAGGNRMLYFTTLDENGARAQLHLPPPYAAGAPRTEAAPVVQVSTPGADVREFKLIWNGRTFRLTWTETQGGRLRHMQTALTRHGSQEVYSLPSSALVRATLINGATNINNTVLPNVPRPPITAANRNHGYGWGRMNLRQTFSPSPPVTFHVRDDEAVGSGRRAQYRFYLPPGAELLRTTLAWTDPPRTDGRIVNNLHLRVVPPGGAAAGLEYHGNTWRGTPNAHLSRPVAPGAPFESMHNIEQVVLRDPPGGIYEVEVIAQPFPANSFNQLRTQPFALVFVGSGQEVRYGRVPPASPIPVY